MTEEIAAAAKKCAKLWADKKALDDESDRYFEIVDEYALAVDKLSGLVALAPAEDQEWLRELYPALRHLYYRSR